MNTFKCKYIPLYRNSTDFEHQNLVKPFPDVLVEGWGGLCEAVN